MASSSAASELKLSFIADLNPEKDLWNMRARVVRKWRSKYWLDFILIDEKPTTCVVVATIKMIQEKHGWFYAGCRKCGKKVLSKQEFLEKYGDLTEEILKVPANGLICPKCKCECQSITTKFMVQVRVQDETGSVSFVLFDTHVARIVGVSATEVRERQVDENQTESFPHEMMRLLDKKLAFKIEVTDYNLKNDYYVYTVLKVSDDPDILAELTGAVGSGDELTQAYSDLKAVNLDENSQDGGSSVAKTLPSSLLKFMNP
ncbi:hypothetical protein QVD17_28961 [Tagetes erecta]|uniref:Replication factor A C-terminal domain-containing protein n=1 Tax=Tagetes erecta TaxID=13708 RepID=A0AAD8KB74_TARER|nr:hypothetical protein QVD17_28961 [Tagetes erecta]